MRGIFRTSAGLVLAAAALGCGSESDPPQCEPTGTWNVTFNFTNGDCGITGADQDSITITRIGESTYQLSTSAPGESTTGTISDDNGACRLSATSTGTDNSDPNDPMDYELMRNYLLERDGEISGSGSFSVYFPSDGFTCFQNFTVATGSKT